MELHGLKSEANAQVPYTCILSNVSRIQLHRLQK